MTEHVMPEPPAGMFWRVMESSPDYIRVQLCKNVPFQRRRWGIGRPRTFSRTEVVAWSCFEVDDLRTPEENAQKAINSANYVLSHKLPEAMRVRHDPYDMNGLRGAAFSGAVHGSTRTEGAGDA